MIDPLFFAPQSLIHKIKFLGRSSTSMSMSSSVVHRDQSSTSRHQLNRSFSFNAISLSVGPLFWCGPLVIDRHLHLLDFIAVCRTQKNRRQLQGRDVILERIHEVDSVLVELTDTDPQTVTSIVDSGQEEIFTITNEGPQLVCIEFLHSHALRQWMQRCKEIETKLRVKIKPNVRSVIEDTENRATTTSNRPPPNKGELKVQHRWAMIINHPVFGLDYRNTIRKNSWLFSPFPTVRVFRSV